MPGDRRRGQRRPGRHIGRRTAGASRPHPRAPQRTGADPRPDQRVGHHDGSGRLHHELEPRRRTAVRLCRGRGRRPPHPVPLRQPRRRRRRFPGHVPRTRRPRNGGAPAPQVGRHLLGQPATVARARRRRQSHGHHRLSHRHHRARRGAGNAAPACAHLRAQRRGHPDHRCRGAHRFGQSRLLAHPRLRAGRGDRPDAAPAALRPARAVLLRRDLAAHRGRGALAGRNPGPAQGRRDLPDLDLDQRRQECRRQDHALLLDLLRHHREEARRGAHPLPRLLRRADRTAEPRLVLQARRPGAGRGAPQPPARRAAVHRPEPLQADQRHARPRRRRPAATADRLPPARIAAHRGRGGAAGRRRIRQPRAQGGRGHPHQRLSAGRLRHRNPAAPGRHRDVSRQEGR